MTPTTDIDVLRAELDKQSNLVARGLADAIEMLAGEFSAVLTPDEEHPGGRSIRKTLNTVAADINALSLEGHRLQALARRVYEAEDTTERRAAS